MVNLLEGMKGKQKRPSCWFCPTFDKKGWGKLQKPHSDDSSAGVRTEASRYLVSCINKRDLMKITFKTSDLISAVAEIRVEIRFLLFYESGVSLIVTKTYSVYKNKAGIKFADLNEIHILSCTWRNRRRPIWASCKLGVMVGQIRTKINSPDDDFQCRPSVSNLIWICL